MVVEHELVSLCNPRQGEPPFTGDGLSCVFILPGSVMYNYHRDPVGN